MDRDDLLGEAGLLVERLGLASVTGAAPSSRVAGSRSGFPDASARQRVGEQRAGRPALGAALEASRPSNGYRASRLVGAWRSRIARGPLAAWSSRICRSVGSSRRPLPARRSDSRAACSTGGRATGAPARRAARRSSSALGGLTAFSRAFSITSSGQLAKRAERRLRRLALSVDSRSRAAARMDIEAIVGMTIAELVATMISRSAARRAALGSLCGRAELGRLERDRVVGDDRAVGVPAGA